jgi:hypothetical protein
MRETGKGEKDKRETRNETRKGRGKTGMNE